MNDNNEICINYDCHYMDPTFTCWCSKGEEPAFDSCDRRVVALCSHGNMGKDVLQREIEFLSAQLESSRETSNQQTELIEALRVELSAAKKRSEQFERGCDSARALLLQMGDDDVKLRERITDLENCYSMAVSATCRLDEQLKKERSEHESAKAKLKEAQEEAITNRKSAVHWENLCGRLAIDNLRRRYRASDAKRCVVELERTLREKERQKEKEE